MASCEDIRALRAGKREASLDYCDESQAVQVPGVCIRVGSQLEEGFVDQRLLVPGLGLHAVLIKRMTNVRTRHKKSCRWPLGHSL